MNYALKGLKSLVRIITTSIIRGYLFISQRHVLTGHGTYTSKNTHYIQSGLGFKAAERGCGRHLYYFGMSRRRLNNRLLTNSAVCLDGWASLADS